MGVPDRYNVSTLIDDNLEAGRVGKVAIRCEDEEIEATRIEQSESA